MSEKHTPNVLYYDPASITDDNASAASAEKPPVRDYRLSIFTQLDGGKIVHRSERCTPGDVTALDWARVMGEGIVAVRGQDATYYTILLERWYQTAAEGDPQFIGPNGWEIVDCLVAFVREGGATHFVSMKRMAGEWGLRS